MGHVSIVESEMCGAGRSLRTDNDPDWDNECPTPHHGLVLAVHTDEGHTAFIAVCTYHWGLIGESGVVMGESSYN